MTYPDLAKPNSAWCYGLMLMDRCCSGQAAQR